MREMPATLYRGYHYVINTASKGDGVFYDAFSIHKPMGGSPNWSKSSFQRSISEASAFSTAEEAEQSARRLAMAWIDQHQ